MRLGIGLPPDRFVPKCYAAEGMRWQARLDVPTTERVVAALSAATTPDVDAYPSQLAVGVTSGENARRWAATHPEVSGVILTQRQALRLGVDIFGHLLDE